MGNYLDSAFVVLNDTIISYNGPHPSMEIPERFADNEISKIGDGAFMESVKLQRVTLPPKIKEIGKRAFWNCPALTTVFLPAGVEKVGERAFANCPLLSDITIYGLELAPNEYHALKTTGRRSGKDVYVLRKLPGIEPVQKLVASVSGAKPAYMIPDNISSLFQLSDPDGLREKECSTANLPVIGFTVPSVPTTEDKAFCDHVSSGRPEVYDVKAEEKNDWYVRVGGSPVVEKTILFAFNDAKTIGKNGKFLIEATLKIGYFFWQSAQPVMYDNKEYFIYRRHYLNADPEMEYVRRDIAVYSEKGLVNSREVAKNVYTKYKLLSIL